MTDNARWSLPIQAPPVDRLSGSAGRSGGPGVEPSDWFTDLIGAVGPAVPGILGAFGI